ncbi:MAG: DUF3299 domain-containing protein [Pseudomonadota bacterium]
MTSRATNTAVVVLVAQVWLAMAAVGSEDKEAFNTIDWTELIPPHVLEILMNPPDYLADIEDGSVEDQISSQIKSTIAAASDDAYQQALVSTEVNAEMNGAMVRIPGFIVPLEFDEQQTVTQFFLVPYFGACLHMPPPPPNQIILVDSNQGIQLQELYTPFWISGKMATTVSENDVATSAYSMNMIDYEVYAE